MKILTYLCWCFIILTSVNGTYEVTTLPNNFCHIRIVEQIGITYARVYWYNDMISARILLNDGQNGHTYAPSYPVLSPFRYKVDLIGTDQTTGWINLF